MKPVLESINWLSQYNKAIAPLLVALILKSLMRFGIFPEMTVEQLVTVLVGVIMAAVWAIPNRK